MNTTPPRTNSAPSQMTSILASARLYPLYPSAPGGARVAAQVAALPQRFSDGLCVEVSVPISVPVAFPFSIPVGPGDDGRGLCVELVLPIPSAVGFAPPLV